MLKKEIYVIRHGETENNRLKIWGGCSDKCNLPLNNTGRTQALKAAGKLKNYNLEAIFCSKLLRAQELGNILSCYLDIPYLQQDGLHEIDYGKADGMLIKDVWSEMPVIADKFINMRREYFADSFPDGETLQQCLDRTMQALQEIVQQPYKRVAVTSHAGLMCVLLCSFGVELPQVANCGFFKIIYDGTFHLAGDVIVP